MEKQVNVPKLRFPEFSEDWKENKLLGITEVITDFVAAGSFESLRNNVIYSSTQDFAQLVRTMDLKNSFTSKESVYVNKSAFEFLHRVNLNEKSIVLPNIGANIGESYFINPDKLPHKYNVLGPNAILLKTKNNNIEFVYYTLCSDNYLKQLKECVGASGQPKFNKTELRNFNFIIPTLHEQTKIANFLTAVDDKLTQLKKKKSLLEQYKKGVMQKLFSQKLRFKDENGEDFAEWEEKKLGDIINFLADYTANGSFASLKENVTYYNEENYAVLVRTTDLEKPNFKPERFTDKRGYDFLKKTSLFGGELVLANVGSIGKVYKVPFYDKPMTLAPNTYTIRLNNDNSIEYVYQWMKSNEFLKKILSMVGSSTLKAINKSNLRDIDIICPSLPEQTKIANFLSSIDDKINHCSIQIEKMEGWKKGLLQQMFV